jgi:hypothetical protein
MKGQKLISIRYLSVLFERRDNTKQSNSEYYKPVRNNSIHKKREMKRGKEEEKERVFSYVP